MPVLSNNRRLALASTTLALLGAAVGLNAGSGATAAAVAAPVALDGAKAAPALSRCAALANRQARAAGRAQANPRRAARAARRTRGRVKSNCLARSKRAGKRDRAPVETAVTGGLVVGVDGGYTGWSDAEIQERKELGAAVTRHEWDPTEPVDEQDDVMEVAAGQIHTRIHALLGGNELGDPAHYSQWVVAFVQRYGLGGSFWKAHPEFDEQRYAITTVELGNEPYFGEMAPKLYAETVRPALEEIQRLNLPVTVALVNRVYGKDTSWMDTLYATIPNLNELFDAFTDHPYWYGHSPDSGTAAGPFLRIEEMRKRMNELGANTKPIWITEYGESTALCGEECVSEATQAAHLAEMISACASRPDWGVTMLALYQLRDRGDDSDSRELEFGLIRSDGEPKPAFSVVRSATSQYRG